MDGGEHFKRNIVERVITHIENIDELLAKIERARRIICSNYLDGEINRECVGYQDEVSNTIHPCHVCKKKWCRRCSSKYRDIYQTFYCDTCLVNSPADTTYICVECNRKTSELQPMFGDLFYSHCSKHGRKGP